MQAPVVDLGAGAEAARDEEGVHGRLVGEGVVGQDGEPGLGLHRPVGVGDEKGVELGVEAAGDREHAVGSGEVDDLGVLEHVDPEPEPGNALVGHGFHRSTTRSGSPSRLKNRHPGVDKARAAHRSPLPAGTTADRNTMKFSHRWANRLAPVVVAPPPPPGRRRRRSGPGRGGRAPVRPVRRVRRCRRAASRSPSPTSPATAGPTSSSTPVRPRPRQRLQALPLRPDGDGGARAPVRLDTTTQPTPWSPGAVEAGDFDGDGRADVVARHRDRHRPLLPAGRRPRSARSWSPIAGAGPGGDRRRRRATATST